MSTNIRIFSNAEFSGVRVVVNEGEALFCLSDVCSVLELDASQVIRRLPDGVVTIHPILDNLGRTQNANFVNEDGLYDVILDSRKPEAKKFRKWVTGEVLPAIRKHGGYLTQAKVEEALLNPDTLIRLATQLKAEREARVRIEAVNAQNEAQLAEQAPKVHFANALLASQTNCLVGQLAKIISQNGRQIGQNKLFAWLRANGYLGTKGDRYNQPNQRYIEQGLFFIKEQVHSGRDGVLHTTATTTVTPKGQQYFLNKILSPELN